MPENLSNRKMFDKRESNRRETGKQETRNFGLPNKYLFGGYYVDNSKTLKREYVLQYAKDLAYNLSSDRRAIKKTQLRGFYEKVKSARDNYERNYITLEDALLSIYELAPLSQQSVTRGNAPRLFADFIEKNVEYVKDYESLKAFEQHFRAILCYYPESKK